MSTENKINVHPQAALTEYAALKGFYENRVMLLAQQIHEFSGTIEVLRQNLADVESALDTALEKAGRKVLPPAVVPVPTVAPTPLAEPVGDN